MRLARPVPATFVSNLQSLGFDADVVRRIHVRLEERGLIVIAGGNSVRRGHVLRALSDDLLRDCRPAMTTGEPSNVDLCAAAVATAARAVAVIPSGAAAPERDAVAHSAAAAAEPEQKAAAAAIPSATAATDVRLLAHYPAAVRRARAREIRH